MAANTLQITPFMHVADVPAAVRFFVDILGFAAPLVTEGYAYVEREGAGIRILGHAAGQAPPPHGFAYYIDVRDLAVVERELGPALATLPPGLVRGPVDQPYGQRELMIRAPDGNLVVFGQALSRA